MGIYLDYNASAPIDERVLDVIISGYKNVVGNADSRTHDFGDNARKNVEDARQKVASLLAVKKDEIFFTSGATESNNISLLGLKDYGIQNNKKHIIVSSIEHKAVIEAAKSLEKDGFEIDFLKPDLSGRVSIEDLKLKVREDTLLVSIMHANNETGIIQPVKEIGDYLNDLPIYFHVDATQSVGKLVDDLRDMKYDMLSFSAHKIGGPQGIGVLVLRKKRYKLPPIKPIMFGGKQEHGIRPGTLPNALIMGLGKACELVEFEYKENEKKYMTLRNHICIMLENSGLVYGFNGNQDYCLSNTMNLYLEGVSSEALMLSTKNYCGISNGSACNSSSYEPSYVLKEMGIPIERIDNSIRISWGPNMKMEELEKDFTSLLKVAKELVF